MKNISQKTLHGIRKAPWCSFISNRVVKISRIAGQGCNPFLIRLFIACAVVLLSADDVCATINITTNAYTTPGPTYGLSANPCPYPSTNYAVGDFNFTGSGTSGTTTFTSLTFHNKTDYDFNLYADTAYLYSSPTNSFASATKVATTALSGSDVVTFTGLSISVSYNTSSAYYFVVLNRSLGYTTGGVELQESNDTNTGTNPTDFYSNSTFINYTFMGFQVTLASLSTTAGAYGLVANPVPYQSANYSVFGFSMTANTTTGSGNITSLTFENYNASADVDDQYYTTAFLYRSTSGTYVPGTTNVPGNLIATEPSDGTQNIVFTTNISVSNTGNTPVYYFLVFADDLGDSNSIYSQWGFSASTYTATSGRPGNPVTAANYQEGPAYTFNPLPPNISYLPANYVFALNAAIATISPTNSGGPVAPAVNYGTGTVVIPATYGLSSPWGMGTDGNGNVYVCNDASAGSVTEYSTAGVTSTFISSAANPIGIVFDSSGNAYVLTTGGSVLKYNGSGSLQSTIITGLATPMGIAIDNKNNLYVSYNTKYISKYTTAGGTATFTLTAANPLYPQTGVAVDPAGGHVFVDNNSTSGYYISYYLNAAGSNSTVDIAESYTGYGLMIDGSSDLYEAQTGNKDVLVYTGGGTLEATLTASFSSPRGLTTDSKGDLFVSDYTNNTVTEFKPTAGYYINGTLPPGLSFNGTTGQITGTPTATFPTTAYTITAYNIDGPGSTTITLTCGNVINWICSNSANTLWTTGANWSGGAAPASTDAAYIGATSGYRYNYLPTITSGTVNVGSIVIGTLGSVAPASNPGITVSGGKLVVAGSITYQSDGNSYADNLYTAKLTGAGEIAATSIAVTANTNNSAIYTEKLASSVANLNLSAGITLTTYYSYASDYANATFNITGGTLQMGGVITTANANAVNTATLSVANATLELTHAKPLSGLSGTGINTITFNGTAATIDYRGAAQTVYTDYGITGLTSGVSYTNLVFAGTGIKTPNGIGTNNLNIAGNYADSLAHDASDYASLQSTIVNFNGSTQLMYGGAASAAYGAVFNTVNCSGTGTKTMSGNFYVAATGTLTMAGSAKLVAGDNVTSSALTTADAYLTLLSGNTGTAAVAQIPANCSITGNVNVQRYISGIRGYRLMSSPVSATGSPNGVASMNYLLNSLYLTGPGSGFTATGNPTLFLYNESFVPQYSTFYNSNFIAVSSMSTGAGANPTYQPYTNGAGLTGTYRVLAGNGYYVFYRGNLSEGTANLTSPSYSEVLPTVATATGTLNQGEFDFVPWYTPMNYMNGTSQHWFLVGNPYASAISLATVQGTNENSGIYMTPYNSATGHGITSFIYELNPVNGVYAVYNTASPGTSTGNASAFIGSGQGFFIEDYGGGAADQTVYFNESAKATGTNGNLPVGFMDRRVDRAAINPGIANPILRLKMSVDSINNEETVITFNPQSNSGYVINEDARHWKSGGLVGFTSISSDNMLLSINSLPLTATQAVPLRAEGANDGVYTINLSQQLPLPDLYDIWLMDAYKKDSLDIKHNPTYSFDILHSDTNSYGNYRFKLVIRQNPALMVHLLNFTAVKVSGGNKVAWTTENEANYTGFVVQRSTDGGQVFAALDSLESGSLGNYSFMDGNPVQGANSYRLQLTDLNGNITYSSVITIMYANTGNQIALNGFMVYPNPTAGAVNLSIIQSSSTATAIATGGYSISILNNLGVVVKTAQSSSPQWQTDVSALAPGTYFITVMNSNTKMMVGKSAFVKL